MSLDHKITAVRTLLDTAQEDYAPVAFASSFGAEDMVLTDLIARHYPAISMFTLDTGRLPEETYSLMRQVAERYGIRIPVYFPNSAAIEAYVAQNGPNGFYDSVEFGKMLPHTQGGAAETCLEREACLDNGFTPGSGTDQKGSGRGRNSMPTMVCTNSALAGLEPARSMGLSQTIRCPLQSLHDKGYASIGCAPCTRAITPGEDVRAGRWWWEDPEIKECGLHPDKRHRRSFGFEKHGLSLRRRLGTLD